MLKIEDLKEGEIYLYDYNWLSKFPKGGALNINTRDWREEKKLWLILNIKPATPEQKHWFKECEKANKFIPYEEAMKTFKKENESLVGRYVKCIKSGSGLNIGNHFKIINWRQGLFDKGFSFHGFQNEFYNYFELMPEGWTPEQENKPQFEVGKWYTHQKWSPNSYIKFSSIRDYNSVFELERISQGSYKGRNTNWSISYEHTLEEAKMEVVSQFLPDNHPDKIVKQESNMFKKGDYIVTLSVKNSGNHNCAKNNYCFKQRENHSGIYPEIDLQGSLINGHYVMSFDKTKFLNDWRYATPEEIAEYDKLGKPYDVTTLQKKQHKYEVVHCKTQEEWDFALTKVNNIINNNRTGWKTYKENSGLNINSGSQADVPWWKDNNALIYSFEEWCNKFGHKPDFLNKQEEWIPKVGDWVVYIGNNRDSSEAIKGKAYKLKKVGVYFPELEGLSEAQDEVLLSNLRKALPHEIPQENNNDIIEVGDEVKFIGYTNHNSKSKWYKPSEIFSKSDEGIIVTILDISGEDGGAYKVKTPRGYTALRRTAFKLIKKASQTTNYIHEKQVDSVSPQVNTDLIFFKKAKKAKEIDILPVQSPIFVNQKVNNKKQLLILN